jgi:AcrR family transcriptional regulator
LLAVEPGLRERKKRETRTRIVAAAFDLFQSRGYDQTTLQEIAERAQVAPRTVSNYFAEKADLLVAYREDMLAVIEAELGQSSRRAPLEAVRRALVAVARANERHPNGRLAQRLLLRHASYRALGTILERFQADLRTALAGAALRPGVDLDLAVLALTSAHLAVIRRWASRSTGSLATDVEQLFDLWARGVAP